MNVGLDIGASEFRSVVQQQGKLLARRVRAEYVVVPGTPVNTGLCERLRLPYLASAGDIIVCGQHAATAAEIFHQPRVPLLPFGLVPKHDPVARQLCDALLQSILPRELPPGTRICSSLPLQGIAQAQASRQFLLQLIERRCPDVRVTHSATSLVLASGQEAAYTGLGVCVGAAGVSYSLCRHGVPLLEGTHPRGMGQLLEKLCRDRHRYRWDASGNRYLDLHWVEQLSQRDLDLARPQNGDERMLRDALVGLMRQTLRQLSTQMESARSLSKQQLRGPMLISGGVTQLNGFERVCQEAIAEASPSIRFTAIMMSPHDPFTVARGALIGLELNAQRHAS